MLRRARSPLTMHESTGYRAVDFALADLARNSPEVASAARAGFESLTWGEGPEAVTGHGLADFLWYQLPLKWMTDLDKKLQIAAALAELFTRLGKPRYAALCASPTTAAILTAYEHDGETAGLKAYRTALAATGYAPPDIPGVIEWGTVMGSDEASAYWSASVALEQAIDAGHLKPGAPGWRTAAQRVATRFLHSPRDDVTGATWLQWMNTELLERWANSRGPTRSRLAAAIADHLTNPTPTPVEAAHHVAPMQWLLDHAATGAALTQTGNLARPIVADGCRRFDWLTLTGNPRSESDIVELWTLRDLAKQMGAIRRSGRKLLLSTTGKAVHAGGTDRLWDATMSCLPGPGESEAAAAEIALMLLLGDHPMGYQDLNEAVAQALAEEGWRNQRTGQPTTEDQAASLLVELRRRLELLSLTIERRFDHPTQLNDAGRRAAQTVLRTRALRRGSHPHE